LNLKSYKECRFLGCGAMWILWNEQTFRKNVGSFHRTYTAPHPRRRHSS
jgi:hypothetical protein